MWRISGKMLLRLRTNSSLLSNSDSNLLHTLGRQTSDESLNSLHSVVTVSSMIVTGEEKASERATFFLFVSFTLPTGLPSFARI